MPDNIYTRTTQLLGEEAVRILRDKHILIFGLGGVGGFTLEALARTGVGSITIVDGDSVDPSNANRQIIATSDTIGMRKVDAWKTRINSINPDIAIKAIDCFYLPENSESIDFNEYDYVIDCIDTVTAKISIIERCNQLKIPVISSMGTGNKLDPGKLCITDISKTSVCPLAKTMRVELRRRGINHVKVIYSTEEPHVKRRPPGSVMWVPGTAGLMIAGEVVKDLLG